MLRGIARAAVVLGAAAGLMAPAIASNAMEIASVVNPVDGCTYSAYGPDFTIHTLPTPGITKSGGVSETVTCN